MEKLPSEAVTNILSRLPTGSLAQARRVCKSWSNTIHDPYFLARYQLQNYTQNKCSSYALLSNFVDTSLFKLCYVEYDGKTPEITKINHPPIEYNMFPAVVGSCNGLICLSRTMFSRDCTALYVCNPVTRECIYLPNYGDREYLLHVMVKGFGYSPSTNEYKVIVICCTYCGTDFDGQVLVYTLGKDTKWRRNGNAPYWFRHDYSGVLVNGALHWLTMRGYFTYNHKATCDKIVAFDLAHEEFQVIPSPPCFRPVNHCYLTENCLLELGGCLCATDNLVHQHDGHIDIWMLNETLWTKKYRIGVEGLQMNVSSRVLLSYSGDVALFSYYPKTGRLGKIHDSQDARRVEAVPYLKTWVSLKAIGENPMIIGEEGVNRKLFRWEREARKD